MTTENQPAVTVTETETETEVTVPQPEVETHEVSVEKPAKIVETTEVDFAPDVAGDAQPDAATEAMEAEPKHDDK